MSKPSVFISYSHKDEKWKNLFATHLKALVRQGDITLWDDLKIGTGDDWYPAIQKALQESKVGICLLSADYLASGFINKEEIPAFMDRRKNEGMLIIPILIRPCAWKTIRWLKNILIFPRDNISIEEIPLKVKREKALVEITEYIYDKINEPSFKEIEPVAPEWAEPEKIDIGRLPETGAQLFGRDKELKQLDEAWASSGTNIISFIAWGGVGKSTLINKWLEYMKADNYKEAERVFAWSFYSQGTSEQVSSADTFISEALSWFGDPDPTSGSAWDKGQRLAGLIRQKKTLLILDGMEPLQSSHEFERGKIKDQGLTALLRSLALNNNGLCMITSRENVADIAKYEKKVKQVDLETLSANAGRALLRVSGVKGTDQELEAAVATFGYHALAVKLLPVYLRSIKGHHISEAQKIPGSKIPVKKGKHPRRVIEALSQRFMGKAEGDLLQLLGFFDRPADIAAIKKIIAPPVIENLTGNLCGKGEARLLQAMNTLRNEDLLAQESKHRPDTLDCHPLIREHFGEKLQKQNADAWKEAHARLYEYYKSLPKKLFGKELPDTLEEMEPLFAAVMHGCLAGKHQEAMFDVYWKRIKRGDEHHSTKKLGAFGADLSCLSGFFEKLWDKPVFGSNDDIYGAVLSWAGFRLRAVGRLSEAAQPMKAGLEAAKNDSDWKSAAQDASNLSELVLTLGDVASAQKYGAQGVIFADRSGDGFQMEVNHCTHANALHQAGKNKAAEKLFIETENKHKKRQPEYPYLYSSPGFQLCDLLLSMGKYQEVLERIKKCFEWRLPSDSLLDISLENLSFGKACMLLSVTSNSSDFTEAEDYLNQAVDGLREAGTQHRIPLGLFTYATLSRLQKDFLKSWADLDEAREIAEYGQMRLHLTDYHLEACRNINAQLSMVNDQLTMDNAQLSMNNDQLTVFEIIENGETLSLTKAEMQARFQEHFKEAERLVKETGYHRRNGELEELRKSGGIINGKQ